MSDAIRDSCLDLLRPARMHEACGAGRVSFALAVAARLSGPVLWIGLGAAEARLFPPGAARSLDPGRLLFATASNETDLLWLAEEGLRSGAAPLVVASPRAPLSLLAGRRLQLAAEAGRATGLMLVEERAGSPAAETRWRCEPLWNGGDSTRLSWSLIKNKRGILGSWALDWNDETGAVHLVSEIGERSGAAPGAA